MAVAHVDENVARQAGFQGKAFLRQALLDAEGSDAVPRCRLKLFKELIHRPRGIGRLFPPRLLLGDHVVHELDILYALDREPDIPAGALRMVLNTEVTLPNPFVPAHRNSRRLRLQATDVGWSHGDRGPVVRGRASDIISVLANRPHKLEQLDGNGVSELASRVTTGASTS